MKGVWEQSNLSSTVGVCAILRVMRRTRGRHRPLYNIAMHSVRSFCVAVAVAVPLNAQVVPPQPPAVAPAVVLSPAAQQLKQLVDVSTIPEVRGPDFTDYRKHLQNLYEPIGYTYLWTRGGRPTPQARAVIDLFARADSKGINSTDYDAPRWVARVRRLQ
jgi:hypothetical protein